MKNLIYLSAFAALAACGVSESKFAEKFGEKLCEEYETCNPDVTCSTDGGGTEVPDTCEYDKGSAKDCLNGEFTCDDSLGEGFEYVVPPDACAKVYTCSGTTGGTTAE